MEKDDIEKLGDRLTKIATNALTMAEWRPSKEDARDNMKGLLQKLALTAASNEGTLAVSGMLYMVLVSLSVNKDSELLAAMTAFAEERAALNNAEKVKNDSPLGL